MRPLTIHAGQILSLSSMSRMSCGHVQVQCDLIKKLHGHNEEKELHLNSVLEELVNGAGVHIDVLYPRFDYSDMDGMLRSCARICMFTCHVHMLRKQPRMRDLETWHSKKRSSNSCRLRFIKHCKSKLRRFSS